MSYDHFQLLRTRRASSVLHVTLGNPPVNLLDAKLTRELNGLAKALALDATVKVVVIASADPDFFLCHSDETELLALPRLEAAPTTEIGPFHRIMERFRLLPQITIGQVAGIARGGGLEFLLALDLRFAASRSKFALPEVAAGLIPGGGGTQRLSRLIGYSRALYMLAGCVDVDAATAERWGLVDGALADEQLAAWVDAFAQRVGAFPGPALRAAKEAAAASALPLAQGLLEEQRLFNGLLQDEQARARVEAFYRLGSQDRQKQITDFDQMMQRLPND